MQHGYIDYEDWLKHASGNFKPPALSENDGASMCYTSGTTGNPKGVLYCIGRRFAQHVTGYGGFMRILTA